MARGSCRRSLAGNSGGLFLPIAFQLSIRTRLPGKHLHGFFPRRTAICMHCESALVDTAPSSSISCRAMALLTVEGLRTYFHTRTGIVRAVDGISFSLERGETLGIVGESGSGKSVAMLSLLKLLPEPPARIEAATAQFDGIDLLHANGPALRRIRGKRVSFVFQDPMTALNPYMTVGAQIMESLRVHEGCTLDAARDRAIAALNEVGIHDAASRLNAYPHEFSGGMRQRVMIAMALVTRPDLLIADEPTTALDVTVQAQILALIKELQSRLGLAVIFITHDLGVIAEVCHRVLVMYAGVILEKAPVDELFKKPRHPYTASLMQALPSRHSPGDALKTIPGRPPDLRQPVAGCPFAPRCPHAVQRCTNTVPTLTPLADDRASACLRVLDGEL